MKLRKTKKRNLRRRKTPRYRKRHGGLRGDPLTFRYIEFADYKIDDLQDYAMSVAGEFGRIMDYNQGIQPIVQQEYNPAADRYQEVVSFEAYKAYMLNFFSNNPPYGTRQHSGPLNAESNFILPYFQRFIAQANLVPDDSQPGTITFNAPGKNPYICKPYIYLVGDGPRLSRISDAISRHKTLVVGVTVPGHGITDASLSKYYPNLRERIGLIKIGVMSPAIGSNPVEWTTFLRYIFSNQFFDEVLALCIATQ